MKKVFLCEYIHPEAYIYLKKYTEVIRDWNRISEAEGLINRNLQITDEVMEEAKALKVIAVHGTGLDGVDMRAAKARGIEVFSTPQMNSRSVAEMNVALMLAVGRKLIRADHMIRKDIGDFAQLQGTEFHGKTLGLIGVGAITTQTADICRTGFDMKVIGWSRHLTAVEAARLHIRLQPSIEEVFEKSDVVVIGLSLTEETKGLIGQKHFSVMKPGGFLINTSRGGVLDEKALYEALKTGQMAGAACDVFTEEPVTSKNPLLTLDNFVAAPHLGANTEEALRRVGMAAVDGLLKRLNIEMELNK